MTIKKYNILTGKLNNSIRVKLKDLTGSHFLFYKKGESIEELQKNYYFYQQNCRGTAEKLFSKKSFISSYNDIYKKL